MTGETETAMGLRCGGDPGPELGTLGAVQLALSSYFLCLEDLLWFPLLGLFFFLSRWAVRFYCIGLTSGTNSFVICHQTKQ